MKKIFIGIFAGIINGLFATGGGMILVPSFIYLLKMGDKEARATSVFCILPMVIVSAIFYYKNNFIDSKLVIQVVLGGILGGIIGAKLLNKISAISLKIIFTIFLIYSSYRMII